MIVRPRDQALSAVRPIARRSRWERTASPRQQRQCQVVGAHWGAGCPRRIWLSPGAEMLAPVRDQLLEFWLQDAFYEEFEVDSKAHAYRKRGVPKMRARYSDVPRNRATRSTFSAAWDSTARRWADWRSDCSLAVAGRRLELRQGPERRWVLFHGNPFAPAGPVALWRRTWRR